MQVLVCRDLPPLAWGEATGVDAEGAALVAAADAGTLCRVSPVFDVAEQVLLVDLDDRDADLWRTERLGSAGPHERARQLANLGVNVLVCGAISWPLEALLTKNGIRVIPLVCGNVPDVVQAYRDGTLNDGRFAMPGCCRRRQQVRNRRRGSGNSIIEETS